jgi:hypothetical protein
LCGMVVFWGSGEIPVALSGTEPAKPVGITTPS